MPTRSVQIQVKIVVFPNPFIALRPFGAFLFWATGDFDSVTFSVPACLCGSSGLDQIFSHFPALRVLGQRTYVLFCPGIRYNSARVQKKATARVIEIKTSAVNRRAGSSFVLWLILTFDL